METCANCGSSIGNLETPFLWESKIVCGPCHAKLSTPHVVGPDQVFDSIDDLVKAAQRKSHPTPEAKISPTEKSGTDWGRVLLVLVVVAMVLVIANVVENWRQGVSGLIVINHGSVSASLRASPDTTPEIDSGFTITHRIDDEPPISYRAWEISNQQPSPLVINKVILNGEYSCDIACQYPIGGGKYGRDTSQSLPVTLTIGESQLFFESNFEDKFSYLKDVIFVDIYTNRGNFRHREPAETEELTSDEMNASTQAQQLYQANEAGKQETEKEVIDQQDTLFMNSLKDVGQNSQNQSGDQTQKNYRDGSNGPP